MGWRYRRSTKIGPVRLNFGNSGLTSYSVGTSTSRLTIGKRGATRTTRVPGTGLSFVEKLTPEQAEQAVKAEVYAAVVIVAVAVMFVLFVLRGAR